MGKDKAGAKAALKTAQSGTPVPEKDTSSAKKVGAAAGTSGTKKGSITVAKALPTESAISQPVAPEKRSWEGSSDDWSKDYNSAKRRGISVDDHEDSARDRIEDSAGQRKMDADDRDAVKHVSGYKQGVSAFSNNPKASHGFGHPASTRQGHLRTSGHSGAHQLGKKK